MGMRTKLESIPIYLLTFIENLRAKLLDPQFLARHRERPEDFTRQCQLTFPVVMLFILQKTVKSLQRHLHEFFNELARDGLFEPVSAGAFTHARAKLKHTAFVELNEQLVLPLVAEQKAQLKRWHGHRLFGHDSSLLRLPDTPELVEEFGLVEVKNHHGATGTRYPEARMSVLYDLLNGLGLDARLEPSRVGEVSLAIEQGRRLEAGDVVMNDRGFTGFVYLAEHFQRGVHVIARCSTGSFGPAQELFRLDRAGRSIITKIYAPREVRAELKRAGLPLELIVRFVSVRLPDGKLEVLLTSLLNEQTYPTNEFLDVYHIRWNHETYYGVLKGRLDLENFSGKTVEAVRQDFHAAVLLSNVESLLSEPAAEALGQESAEHKYLKEINRADAYHALKDQLLDLLYSELPAEKVILKLQQMFTAAPVSVRPGRSVPRRTQSLHRSYHFQRRVKKIVF